MPLSTFAVNPEKSYRVFPYFVEINPLAAWHRYLQMRDATGRPAKQLARLPVIREGARSEIWLYSIDQVAAEA
jgi:hypothetical protein